MSRPIVFLWDNFGPMHADRVDAVARRYGSERAVIGLEIHSKSATHEWVSEGGSLFEKRTLFSSGRKPGFAARVLALFRAVNSVKRGHFFLCHYERLEVMLVAFWLRLTGKAVFVMGDSKFDDCARHLWREIIKYFFMLPYRGALAGSTRSTDYLRFLGIRRDAIFGAMNTVSISRWRESGGISGPPDPSTHPDRPFICVARFVPEKNLCTLLSAYALYRNMTERPRDLEMCGSGELEEELRTQVDRLGLSGCVRFRGFLQLDDVAKALSGSLSLILPSKNDTFGYVVVESMACGVPVILTESCGSRDFLVRSGVNGFVVEPDNPQGLAFFMDLLGRDAGLWARMAQAAWDNAAKGDVAHFAESVAWHVELAERQSD